MLITSPQNPRYKQLLELQDKKRSRHQLGVLVVEGVQEVQYALQAGFEPVEAYVPEGKSFVVPGIYTDELSPSLFIKATYRGLDAGVVAVFKQRNRKLEEIILPRNPLVVVLDNVEKPGNAGAVLRSAYAAGADLVVFTGTPVDPWNPNTIRSSVGAVFKQPFVLAEREALHAWLKQENIKLVGTRMENGSAYTRCNLTEGLALLMGEEHNGLDGFWHPLVNEWVYIPMRRGIDSLNLSVSTAILLFEAARQRGA